MPRHLSEVQSVQQLRALAAKLRTRIQEDDDERGSAIVEFIFLGTLLLVPVVYFILSLGAIQAGSFAVVGSSDQASKTIALSENADAAGGQAEAAVERTMEDYGFGPGSYSMSVSCSAGDCAAPDSLVTVDITLNVPLPLIGGIGGSPLSAATVSASSTQVQVDAR